MAGGVVIDGSRVRKIKGRKLTVIRFFAISVAYTIGWYTISSELGEFKLKYGPSILLQLNIAYYLPSIPLLLISGQSDEYLERKFGVVRVVLVRLIVGLVGCAIVTAVFPLSNLIALVRHGQLFILVMSLLLGVFVGIAFSASYQLVSRFANKNVISLGLGFVGSGLVTLGIQLALGIGRNDSFVRHLIMYELVTVITLVGLVCALSILFKHWKAIEEDAAADKESQISQPLLQGNQQVEQLPDQTNNHIPPSSPSFSAHRTLPSLVGFDFLDPMQSISFMDTEDDEVTYPASLPSSGFMIGDRKSSKSFRGSSGNLPRYSSSPSLAPTEETVLDSSQGRPITRALVAADPRQKGGLREHLLPEPEVKQVMVSVRPPATSGATGTAETSVVNKQPGSEAGSEDTSEGSHPQLGEILTSIWPCLTAFYLSGVTILTVFPFFTYVESSGLCGHALPKVLFFIRLGGDIVGRMTPRLKALAITNQYALLLVSLVKFGTIPLYILYLKAPPRYHSDVAIIAYVVILWFLCGYINTLGNIIAPKLVKPQLKVGAAGLMAVTFQISHFSGLLLAVILSFAFFGGLT